MLKQPVIMELDPRNPKKVDPLHQPDPLQESATETRLQEWAEKLPSLLHGRDQRPLVILDSRSIYPRDILHLHLVYGFPPLDARTGTEFMRAGRAPKKFRPDLPEPSRRRILERTIRDCPWCRQDPETSYLTNIWTALCSVLAIRESHNTPAGTNHPHLEYPQETTPFHDRTQRICHQIWPLFCLVQFLELTPVEVLDLSAADCRSILEILHAIPPDTQARP